MNRLPLAIPYLPLVLFLACGSLQNFYGYTIKPVNAVSPEVEQEIRDTQSLPPDLFETHSFQRSASEVPIGYRLLRPLKDSGSGRRPALICVLHGSGAIGTDNTKHLGVLAKLWCKPEIRARYPAYVLAPQFSTRSSAYQYDSLLQVNVSQPQEGLLTFIGLVRSLADTLPIDKSRVYVIGFSMGGSSTLEAVGLAPDLFTAAIAVAPVPNMGSIQVFGKKPLWLIHGNADEENDFDGSKLFYHKLKETGGDEVRFWEYEKIGHGLFPTLYASDEIPRWLFHHKKVR